MIERKIFLLVILLVLLYSIRTKKNTSIIFSTLLFLGVLSTFFGNTITTIGLITFILTAFFIGIRGVFLKLNNLEKISYSTLGLFSFIGLLFAIMNWPGTNRLKLLMFFPIIIFILINFKTKFNFVKTYPFLLILFFECLFRFLRLLY